MIEKPPAGFEEYDKFPAPSAEEVIAKIIEDYGVREYTIGRERKDAEGLYLLEIRSTDEEGDPIQIDYTRAGRHEQNIQSIEAALDVTFLDAEGIPKSGKTLAIYKDGQWIQQDTIT